MFHLLKVNHTLAPVNILLHGLNSTVPNGTEVLSGIEDADADAAGPGKHTFGGGVLPDNWVEILRGKKSRKNVLVSYHYPLKFSAHPIYLHILYAKNGM